MHSFTPSPQIPHLVINKFNFYLSLPPPLTFKNPKQPKQLPKHLPIHPFLSHTHPPYLSPHPYTPKR
ncbi:TatD family hydrolase, partial [Staphylococcus epidermidis]|uniref:TatD family hydrolase n=1 Tax=Staphylococcus epidermidis TaxID=1282 RepID=UPI0037D9D458